MDLDHVALAVRSIDFAAERICRLTGHRPSTSKVTNTRQRVNVIFPSKQGSLDVMPSQVVQSGDGGGFADC